MDKSANISKSEAAYIRIKTIILSFYLIPGQMISIKKLAFDLRFSVTPLREALFALEKDGYVTRNRNDAFYVTNLDSKYISNLFEYGRLLHDFSVSSSLTPGEDYQSKHVNCLSDSSSNVFYIDCIYKCDQENSKNIFLCKQIELFREKSNAIRNALLNSNKKLIHYIYGDICLNSDLHHGQSRRILQQIYTRKFENIDLITESVLSYAINRWDFPSRSELCMPVSEGF